MKELIRKIEQLSYEINLIKKDDPETMTAVVVRLDELKEIANKLVIPVSQQSELLFTFCTYLEETTNIKPFIYKDRIVSSFIEGK